VEAVAGLEVAGEVHEHARNEQRGHHLEALAQVLHLGVGHPLHDLALDVRERIGEQGSTEHTAGNRDGLELVVARCRELLRDVGPRPRDTFRRSVLVRRARGARCQRGTADWDDERAHPRVQEQ
jgi:hypothetical protein